MRRLKASDFPEDVWEHGTAKVKKCLRNMRKYARIDFNVSEEELEEIVNEAMGVCFYIDDDGRIWESLDLIIVT